MSNTNPVFTAVRVQPLWQVFSCFNQKKLSIIIGDNSSYITKSARDVFEQVNDEPFVLHIITELSNTAQVRRHISYRV